MQILFNRVHLLSHILYFVSFLEKNGLGKRHFVTWLIDVELVETLLIDSGRSAGRAAVWDADAARRCSEIVFNIFFPASFVCKELTILWYLKVLCYRVISLIQ